MIVKKFNFTNKKTMLASALGLVLVGGVAFASSPSVVDKNLNQVQGSSAQGQESVPQENSPGATATVPEGQTSQPGTTPAPSASPTPTPGNTEPAPDPAPAPAPTVVKSVRRAVNGSTSACIGSDTHDYWTDIYNNGSTQDRETVQVNNCTVFHG